MEKKIILIGGPNGAGKSTVARDVLRGFQCDEFVNADAIAAALTPFHPERSAIKAGKLMLEAIEDHIAAGRSFAFESTLSARSFAPMIRNCMRTGYTFYLIFMWLPVVEMAINRVQARVAAGGHSIPEPDIQRRYIRGLQNFCNLYLPLANYFWLFNNSTGQPELIAQGTGGVTAIVHNAQDWKRIQQYGSR